jgi:hypothetical protein
MGLSIHYNGKIKDTNLISSITEEVKEICESLQWNYTLIGDDKVKGICFGPENCEPIFITFIKDGRLVCPISLQHKIESSTTISVKTQYAGIDTHVAIIKLLKYLNTKYFSHFEILDEGDFWETEDENVLRSRFEDYESALNKLTTVLENLENKPGETIESTADRLEKFLREKFSGNN